jgi:hypothetical protein
MHRRFYELAAEHAKSLRLRQLLESLVVRCDEFENLERELNEIAAERRSKKEGITRDQIDRQVKHAVEEYGPSPEEAQRFDADLKKFLIGASDADIFRLVRDSVSDEMRNAVEWLNGQKFSADNRPLYVKRVEFHSQTQLMLEELAKVDNLFIRADS